MPSRKGQDQARQRERPGDFVLEGIPRITQHARQRMAERHVSYRDVLHNKVSAGVITNEATGAVITVVPDSFVQDQQRRYQTRRRAGVVAASGHLGEQRQPRRRHKGRAGLTVFETICAEARSEFSKGANGASSKKTKGQTLRSDTNSQESGVSKQKLLRKTSKEIQTTLVLDQAYIPTDWSNEKKGNSARKVVNNGLKTTLKPLGITSTYLPRAPGFNLVGLDPDIISHVEQLFHQGQAHAAQLLDRPADQVQSRQTISNDVALTYICIVVDYVRTLLAFWDYRLALNTPTLETTAEQACLVLPDTMLPKMLLWTTVPGVLKQTIEACGVVVKKVLPQNDCILFGSATKEFRSSPSRMFPALSSSSLPLGAKFLIEMHGTGDKPKRNLALVSSSFERACHITMTRQDHHESEAKGKKIRAEVARKFVTIFKQVWLESQANNVSENKIEPVPPS